jgi:hypothetical protein
MKMKRKQNECKYMVCLESVTVTKQVTERGAYASAQKKPFFCMFRSPLFAALLLLSALLSATLVA